MPNIKLFTLIVVDSPVIEKRIRLILTDDRFSNKNYKVINNKGRFMGFRGSTVGLEKDYTPKLNIIDKKFCDKFLDLVKQSKEVFIGTYPDYRGDFQAIQIKKWLFDKGINIPIYRIKLPCLHINFIDKQLDEKSSFITIGKYKSYLASIAINRIIDFNINPNIGKSILDGATAGLYKSYILNSLIKEKKDTFKIKGFFEDGIKFESKELNDIKECEKALKDIPDNIQTKLSDSRFEQEPPKVFNTFDLCREAHNLFGFESEKTIKIATSLYLHGYISYPITKGRGIYKSQHDKASEYIKDITSNDYVRSFTVSDKEIGIFPVDISIRPSQVNTTQEFNQIYNIVWLRTIASCSVPAVYKNFYIRYKKIIKGKGKVYSFIGFLKFSYDKSFLKYVGTNKVEFIEIKNNDTIINENDILDLIESIGLDPSYISRIKNSLTYHNFIKSHFETCKLYNVTDKGYLLIRYLKNNYKFLISEKFNQKIIRYLKAVENKKVKRSNLVESVSKKFFDYHKNAVVKRPGTSSKCSCKNKYKIMVTNEVVFARCTNKKCKNNDSYKIRFTKDFKIKVTNKTIGD